MDVRTCDDNSFHSAELFKFCLDIPKSSTYSKSSWIYSYREINSLLRGSFIKWASICSDAMILFWYIWFMILRKWCILCSLFHRSHASWISCMSYIDEIIYKNSNNCARSWLIKLFRFCLNILHNIQKCFFCNFKSRHYCYFWLFRKALVSNNLWLTKLTN